MKKRGILFVLLSVFLLSFGLVSAQEDVVAVECITDDDCAEGEVCDAGVCGFPSEEGPVVEAEPVVVAEPVEESCEEQLADCEDNLDACEREVCEECPEDTTPYGCYSNAQCAKIASCVNGQCKFKGIVRGGIFKAPELGSSLAWILALLALVIVGGAAYWLGKHNMRKRRK